MLVRKLKLLNLSFRIIKYNWRKFIYTFFPIYLTKKKFKSTFGFNLNLERPATFNEKIQYLKIYNRDRLLTRCADKITVRDYLKEKGLEHILIPLISTYNDSSEIDYNKLPFKFVLKVNHGSHWNIVCSNKDLLNIEISNKYLNSWIQQNYYYHTGEWAYKYIKPKILCEDYIGNENEDLLEYKFLCFNGVPKCLFVCSNRIVKPLNVDFFDLEWNKLEIVRSHPNSNRQIEQPSEFNKMIEYSTTLSADFIFVRADFYQINKKVYFSELTFYPGNGFERFEPFFYDELFGKWLELKK